MSISLASTYEDEESIKKKNLKEPATTERKNKSQMVQSLKLEHRVRLNHCLVSVKIKATAFDALSVPRFNLTFVNVSLTFVNTV